MSKQIVIVGGLALHAGDLVELFPDHGVVDGETCLYLNDQMDVAVAADLPRPWVPGAYTFADGLFVLDAESDAWKTHQAEEARKFAELVRQYDGVVQARLDDYARQLGYGDPNRPEVSPILHAITYADEAAVPKFQAEGQLLRAWRSLYWAACWPVLEAVRAGQREVPAPAELLAELDIAAPPPTIAQVNAKIAELTA